MGLWAFSMAQMAAVLRAQRGGLICWVPVCMATGIGTYFGLGADPVAGHYVFLAVAAILLAAISARLPEETAPLAAGLALCILGFLLAGARAHSVAGPTLDWRYYGAVEGRVVDIDRSQSDALRLTLDQVRLDNVSPAGTPLRVRVSLHGPEGIVPQPGMRVMTTAHLSPPSGPVEPGGFDFQRHAWFERLGAVGYTRVPVVGAEAASEGFAGLLVFRIRMAASARIQQVLGGDIGGFAAAITTGDRSAISREALDALRASNLAHLLAISGLHMGLLTAVVFGAMRVLLALHPYTSLHWPTRRIAACVALVTATGYLALSGGNVATERAYIMVAVALGALMLGRRALSLRAVAIAAVIVLALRPEALTGPGFQMSFAATVALVAVFGWLREIDMDWLPKWLKPAFSVFVSSAVAGLATAPIAAAHFNMIAHYGLIANLMSVPLMGALIMPAAVLALVLGVIGAEAVGLWIMGLGLRWILGVAHWISDIEHARGHVVGPGNWVLPLLALGFLTLILWRGRLRFCGLVAMTAGFVLWHGAERPRILISDTGTLVGVMTSEGRALSKAKGAGFVARNWLENDGDGADQIAAAARWQEGPVVHLSGKRALAAFGRCRPGQVVVTSVPAPDLAGQPCDLIDPERLRATGAIALEPVPGGWRMTTARQRAGERLWSHWPDEDAEAAAVRKDQYVRINPTSRP